MPDDDRTDEQRRNRERSLANLIPFKPGQSGNPGGRPKGRSLTAILREVLESNELCGEKVPDGRTVGEALIEAMLRHAIKGDATLIREILARIEGKPPDGGEGDDKATTIRVTYAEIDGDDPPSAPGPAANPPLDEAV